MAADGVVTLLGILETLGIACCLADHKVPDSLRSCSWSCRLVQEADLSYTGQHSRLLKHFNPGLVGHFCLVFDLAYISNKAQGVVFNRLLASLSLASVCCYAGCYLTAELGSL